VSCVRDNHHNRDPRYPETTRPLGVVATLGMHSSVNSNSNAYIYIYQLNIRFWNAHQYIRRFRRASIATVQ
jgi:hypothetical protein